MVANPHQQPATTKRHEDNTRAYLLSLASGQKPDIRPEFGGYEPIVKMLEESFLSVTKGDPGQHVTGLIKMLAKQEKYQILGILLAGTVLFPEEKKEVSSAVVMDDEYAMPALPEDARLNPNLALPGCPWVDNYCEYSKQVSPEGGVDMHEACALWVLSTVVAGRIVIPGGKGQHTALNIALVAKPMEWAKSTTANVAVDLLHEAHKNWLLGDDETTPQKLLSDMSGAYPPSAYMQMSEEKQLYWKKRLAMAGQHGWYYDELGSFFRAMNKANGPMTEFRGLLLKLDNLLRSYTYSTRTWGREEIDKPYLSLLGCTTFADFRTIAKAGSDEWNDGMLSRFAFVVPPAGPPSDHPFAFEEIPCPTHLIAALQNLHEWLGYPEIDITEEGDEKKGKKLVISILRERPEPQVIKPCPEAQNAWIAYRSALKKIEKPEDLASSYGRLPVKALRIAALFAAMEYSSIILMHHWAKAQEIAERWRKSLHELYKQVNTSSEESRDVQVEQNILAFFAKHPEKVDARYIQQHVKVKRQSIASEELRHVLSSLVRINRLKEENGQYSLPQ